MKNTLKYSTLIIAGVLALSSCSKQIDILPTDVILPNVAFTNVNDLQAGLNTAYARYNGENTSYINALLSDEVTLGRDWAGQGQFTFRFQYGQDPTTGGDVTSGWGSYYSMIQACNLVLDNVDKISIASPADDAKRIQIRAQALALRALAFFELQERYAKAPYNPTDLSIPIVTTYVDPVQTPTPARNTSGDVLTRIQSDLTLASSLMPASATFTDVTMNRLNITGLQARVALYKGEWKKAADSSGFVITAAVRPLETSGAAFANIWTDANLTSEVLLRIKRNTTASSVDGLYTATTNAVYFNPSAKLRGLYPAGDVRVAPYIGSIYVNKYFTSATLGGRINDLKAMRISEMYLIRAEALVENTGSFTAGSPDLLTLRTARGVITAIPVFATKADAISFIFDERARELAFEGFRFFDLKRRGLNVDRNIADVQSTSWQTLPANDYRFALPIPNAEIQANPNVSQNPNY